MWVIGVVVVVNCVLVCVWVSENLNGIPASLNILILMRYIYSTIDTISHICNTICVFVLMYIMFVGVDN